MSTPLAIDLFCGLGGWAEGLLAEGYDVIGFDIERHQYGEYRYPARLVIQDVRTLHGSQFKDATIIVASPPCQAYSYRAMPWKRAKAFPPPDNALFETCFRIQREACEAGGRYIPMIVENVRGAQKWVGRARWNFGSYYLWGDVPALMPMTFNGVKVPSQNWNRFKETGETSPHWRMEGIKVPAASTRRTNPGNGVRFTTRDCGTEGRKGVGSGAGWFDQNLCAFSSKSSKRKFASAMIAKIPLPLSRYIGATFRRQVKVEAA